MKDNNRIALSGHAAKWIDLYANMKGLRNDYCITILGCYGWTYDRWYNEFINGREIMEADYNATIDFFANFNNKKLA